MIKSSFLRPPLLFGLLAGLICFAYFGLLYRADAMPLGPRRNLGLIFVWVAMALAVRQFIRDVQRPIQFLEAFGICILTVLIAGLVDSTLVVSFVNYADPGMLPRFISQLKTQALTDRLAMQDLDQAVDFEDFIRRIGQIDLRSIFWANFSVIRLSLSFLYSALVAVFFRRMSQVGS